MTPSGLWIVDSLLRTNRKRISLLCGSPHAGKSTLARQLAVAVVHGEPFLGRTTVKSTVAYWQTEESEDDAREDFLKSGMTINDLNFKILHPEPPESNLKKLNDTLTNDPDIRLVIIETLDDFLQMDDLGDNPSARRAFEKFDQTVVSQHSHRCCFVALHHFKKSDEQHGSSLHRILGATVIAGKTDCKIFMRGCGDADSRRVINIMTRKGSPIEPTYLAFNDVTQTSTLGQTLAEECVESKKAGVSVNASELRSRCLSVVAGNLGISKTQACEKVGGRKEAALKMFGALIQDGEILPRLGGETGTAHLLYVKGAAPETQGLETQGLETPETSDVQSPQKPPQSPESSRTDLLQAQEDLKLAEATRANNKAPWVEQWLQRAQVKVAELKVAELNSIDSQIEGTIQ